jgi:valyl-tRNA synthetase
MVSEFPRYNPKRTYKKDLEKMNAIMDIIKAIRAIKVQTGAPASKKVDLFVVTENQKLVKDCSNYIQKLSGVQEITFVSNKSDINEKVVSQILGGFEIYIPLGELVDIKKEIERLKAELENTENEILRATNKLNNEGFVRKAPKNLVDAEKQKLEKYIELKAKITANLKEYES